MNQIHLIDILHEVSGGIFSTDLERYIQIDIDDMFVGSEVQTVDFSKISNFEILPVIFRERE